MNGWKVILATMFIFGTGVVTGGLLVRYTEVDRGRNRDGVASTVPRQAQPPNPGVVRVDFLKRAQRELDLSPDQRQQVERIISQSQERTRRITEPVAPQLREEVQRAKAEFRAVLSPAQQALFDNMIKQTRPRDPRERKTNKPG